MLADVTAMCRSALSAVNWEAQADSLLSALLSRGTSVSEGHGESFKIFLISVLTSTSMTSRAIAPFEESLAPAAYEDS